MVKLISFFIRFYQLVISPLIPPRCRYLPTCSDYALEALKLHGIRRGVFLSFSRIMRCHPWGKSGLDPVPKCASEKTKQGLRDARQ